MRNTTWTPALSALGVALLVSSCAGDASATHDEPAPSTSEKSEVADFEADEWVPLTEEHLADGLEMTECVAAQTTIRVPPDYVVEDEEHLESMCPETTAVGTIGDGGQQIVIDPDGVEFMDISPAEDDGTEVYHLYCQDEEALAEKAAYNDGDQPVGWPQDWDGTGAMPDPYCHPDYLEIGEWEHLEAFVSRWEGIETSTIVDTGQSQDEINELLWEQSQARAEWTP